MLQKIFLLFFFTLNLFSYELHSVYYVNSKNITLQDIVPHAKENVELYKISKNKHAKKIKADKLIVQLNKHGINSLESSSRYIRFILQSPIDTSKIESSLLSRYKENYPNMKINSIQVVPRAYVKSLPDNYKISLHKKFFLSKEGTLNIKTLDNKKLFFDYIVDADLYVYISRENIHKGDRISPFNTTKKSVVFDKFRALPINTSYLNVSQAKRNLKTNKVLTLRDIQSLDLVKKNSNVNVSINDGTINISFSAKALQNGKLNDIITVQKSNRQRLRAKVIGKDRVELK